MKFLMRLFALCVALVTMPVLADTSVQVAPANVMAVADIPSTARGIMDMPLSQLIGIVGGGALGGALADSFLGGGVISLAGVVIGAMVGNTWYEKRYWPY